ncbi:hypothetical protein RCH12_003549 [Cryobacterium sp. MP_3.1]|uniref:hypothetical protein n=1 Tax=Cryobacterium sp. MP_3.1 TaxID=3071711 RepID=UPI002E00B3E6|nr:hypothetical protein [Cryobacterium sp. MP_3.1]
MEARGVIFFFEVSLLSWSAGRSHGFAAAAGHGAYEPPNDRDDQEDGANPEQELESLNKTTDKKKDNRDDGDDDKKIHVMLPWYGEKQWRYRVLGQQVLHL